MVEEIKAVCPVCDYEVGTKENGTKIKAHKISGQKCEGSDSEVQSSDEAPEGLEKGDSFESLDSAQELPDETNEETDPVIPEEPETGTQGVASSSISTFVHTVTVSHSCPYLDDQAWHAENKKMAAKVAAQAGHVLAGAEAEHIQTEPAGDVIHVHYAVLVK